MTVPLMIPDRRDLQQLRDSKRLEVLHASGLLDATRVEMFDCLARTASDAVRAPVAQVNPLTADEQVPKACFAPESWASRSAATLEYSFCQHVASTGRPMALSDARTHPLLRGERGALPHADGVHPDGIVLMDDAGMVVAVNPAMERIFGYGREEMVNRSLSINDVLSEAESLVMPRMTAKQIHFSTERRIGDDRRGGGIAARPSPTG